MPNCYCSKTCKHNYLNFCTKYDKPIIVSRNMWHPGLLIHPLHYLTLYYNYDRNDIGELIALAKKFLTDETSKSLCGFYDKYKYLTFKQRKLLLHQFFDCFEKENKTDNGVPFCQVE